MNEALFPPSHELSSLMVCFDPPESPSSGSQPQLIPFLFKKSEPRPTAVLPEEVVPVEVEFDEEEPEDDPVEDFPVEVAFLVEDDEVDDDNFDPTEDEDDEDDPEEPLELAEQDLLPFLPRLSRLERVADSDWTVSLSADLRCLLSGESVSELNST